MMAEPSFTDRLLRCAEENDSLLCIGLDPDLDQLPRGFDPRTRDILRFNRAIIKATADLVCAYKPNLAFYEVLGKRGWEVLSKTIEAIPPSVPVIVDAKRGDVAHSATRYAQALFEGLGAHAVTVNPLLGTDSVEPFLGHRGRGVFVVCLTSNEGAREFLLKNGLHLQIARRCRTWSKTNPDVGLVVGATHPRGLKEIRSICPDQLILVPGFGAQGGDIEATLRAGVSHVGPRLILSASRSIIHASRGSDFAKAARREAQTLREAILRCVQQMNSSKRSTRSSAKS